MQQHAEAIFLTDDAAARLAGITLGYKVHGSIGILIRAIRRSRRSKEQILTLPRSIPTRSSLHIRPSLLREIIAQVEAES